LVKPNTALIQVKLIEKRLSVNDAARRLRMKPYNLSKMIHGHQPFYEKRAALARLLGVCAGEVFPVALSRK